MSEIKALLIDLDDTLFEEHEYALSGYSFVADYLARKFQKNQEEIYRALEYQFYKFGRNGAFDAILKMFDIKNQDVKELVQIYRNHIPNIKLYDGALNAILKLKKKYEIAIVTDGNEIMQKNKILALEISKYFDAIVYCHEIGEPKPSVKAYEYAAKLLGVDIDKCAIIGDDPMHDGKAAAELKIDYYRVLTGRFGKIGLIGNFAQFDNFSSAADFLGQPR